MKTIGVLANLQSPATDIYRSVHPFSNLGFETIVLDPNNIKWYELYKCNLLVCSRPNGTMIYSLLSEFKRMSIDKKIIVDCDDLLHELDPSNPSFPHFNRPDVKESVIACMNLADHIIFSTKALQDHYSKLTNTTSTVVPNAIDFNITPMLDPRPVSKPVRVLWRGSEHHLRDLETIRPFWDWILKEPGYEVLFMGLQPHHIDTYFKGAKCVTWNPSSFAYWEKLAALKADVGIFPLDKTLFNYGKSNIFALEMLCNGVLPVVPIGFPEFEHRGVYTFLDAQELISCFKPWANGENRIENIREGQLWLFENRNLATVNVARAEIIEGL